MTESFSPPVDSDQVIKGFGTASETTLLLSEALKLFLSLERNNIKNPYDIIEDHEVINVCSYPDHLPEHTKKFVSWQTNILKIDADEISKTELPKGMKLKYDVKGKRLEELDDETRKQAIQRYMDELEKYFRQFNDVLAILEATEDRFTTIESMLLRAESLDANIAARIQAEKQQLEEIRKNLCDLRAILEDEILPDVINFEHAPSVAKGMMTKLSALNISIKDTIRKYNVE